MRRNRLDNTLNRLRYFLSLLDLICHDVIAQRSGIDGQEQRSDRTRSKWQANSRSNRSTAAVTEQYSRAFCDRYNLRSSLSLRSTDALSSRNIWIRAPQVRFEVHQPIAIQPCQALPIYMYYDCLTTRPYQLHYISIPSKPVQPASLPASPGHAHR